MATQYEAVDTHEKDWPGRNGATSVDGDEDYTESSQSRPLSSRRHPYWIWLIHGCLLAGSLTAFLSALLMRSSAQDFTRRFSAYSPAVEAVEYHEMQYNFSAKSPYVGFGPEVDRAWFALSYDIGDQFISDAERRTLGMPATHLRATDPATGAPGYRVGMEVFHQLHCVNMLRQMVHREYYEPLGGNFRQGEDMRAHSDHCLEVLRRSVQCSADIGLFTFYLVEGDPVPWPALNSRHVCRDFEAVKDWAVSNSIGDMERGLLV